MSAQSDTATSDRPGPLDGIRVVELASEHAAFAGKLLAELGAEVVVVEPPEGHPSRHFEPFVDDVADIEGSLWWWHYNTSKLGVTIDLDAEPGAFADLVGSADVVLEGERPGRLRDLGIDYSSLRAGNERLVWLSVTPFGTDNPRADGGCHRPHGRCRRRRGLELRLRRSHAPARCAAAGTRGTRRRACGPSWGR